MTSFDEVSIAITPGLVEVADYIPARTVATGVGEQNPVNTFTSDTTPNSAQAARIAESAARYVASRVGTIDKALYDMARSVAAMRAAGLIELAYPIRDGDINTAQQLLAESASGVAAVLTADITTLDTSGGSDAAQLPRWSFPVVDHCYGHPLI